MYRAKFIHKFTDSVGDEISEFLWRSIYADDLNHAVKIAEARAKREGWILVFLEEPLFMD